MEKALLVAQKERVQRPGPAAVDLERVGNLDFSTAIPAAASAAETRVVVLENDRLVAGVVTDADVSPDCGLVPPAEQVALEEGDDLGDRLERAAGFRLEAEHDPRAGFLLEPRELAGHVLEVRGCLRLPPFDALFHPIGRVEIVPKGSDAGSHDARSRATASV